jgi:hypothetical protein
MIMAKMHPLLKKLSPAARAKARKILAQCLIADAASRCTVDLEDGWSQLYASVRNGLVYWTEYLYDGTIVENVAPAYSYPVMIEGGFGIPYDWNFARVGDRLCFYEAGYL